MLIINKTFIILENVLSAKEIIIPLMLIYYVIINKYSNIVNIFKYTY